MADRVAVVGAGVIGASTALELARAGARATLLEADGIAAGVSGASLAALTRHLAGDPADLPFVLQATDRWRSLAGELRRVTGLDVEHETCGQLALVEDEEALTHVGELAARERAHGLAVELLDAAAARRLVAGLHGPRVVGATWCPSDAKINALLACRALVEAAARRGADVRTGHRVERIVPASGGWRVQGPWGALDADAVVVACGPWTAPLLADHQHSLLAALRPKRAQCCVTERLPRLIGPIVSSVSVGISTGYTQLHQTRHGEVLFNTVVETGDPRLPGGGLDDRVDHRFLVTSARRLVELFPALARTRVLRAWGACEAWTPDRRFLIGPVGAEPGLFVAAGDSGVGFLQAPMVARAVAGLATGVSHGRDLERYAPARSMAATAA